MARTMLIESELPKDLWTYAVMTAVHVRNRMYNERIQNTPYQLLVGSKPSISKLHMFGSVCYANVHIKKKLDARSKKGYFIGYDKYSPSYLIYFPDTKKITKNATVTFTDKLDSECEEVTQDKNQDDLTETIYPNIEQEPEDLPEPEEEEQVENQVNQSGYPQRQRNKPKYLDDYHCYNYDSCCYFEDKCFQLSEVPKTYNQAKTNNNAAEWQEAMDSEMESLKKNQVYTVTKLPEGKKAIGSRWVYSIKDNPNGELIHKARFVAKGYSQVQGSDYSDTFSPTAKMSTVRMIMQISAENKLMVHHLDVKTAYLNAPIDCEVYIAQPEGYTEKREGENLVWKLNKSLYGLKQSGRNWNFVLSEFFQKHNFKKSNIDPCLFHKQDENNKMYIVIWVDDIVVSASTEGELNATKSLLKKEFRMKDLGPISYFLGIQFHQDPITYIIEMNQSHYLKGVLQRFNMADCKPKTTPCEVNLQVYDDNQDSSSDKTQDTRRYREIVGSLVYAMTCSRPDLAWIVTKLSQHLNNPTEADWITIKHVLRYIKGSLNHKLVFKKSKDGLEAIGYSDSDLASSKEDRKSTTGFCFTLNSEGPMISWKSKKQQTVALSSCEAEYMALTAATQEAIFLSNLAEEFGIVTDSPTRIFGDNQGSIALVKNPVNHEKTKHIDIKHHFVREKFSEGIIDIMYIPTSDNIADLMTKPATKVKLTKFHQQLFGQ